ncbi:hypothetical protein [Candidatus Poriferisodalis sp.]|uniref:HORMA-1 domain-containing protein n=1 Tax=Candidatus Poriferisodalis sp. TaxID=3101277 RepID=UPI003D110DD0
MTRTVTETSTFSVTSARHVASKVAADLRLIQLAYGDPDDDRISKYEAELVELLAGLFVHRITYGFRCNGLWIPPSLIYEARIDGTLTGDDRAGRIPRNCDISGASFASFLIYSAAWDSLTPEEVSSVRVKLPFERSSGDEPGTASGSWNADKAYSHNGGGVARTALRPIV